MPNTKIHHRQMNERDRYKLEALYNKNIPIKEIAKELGFSKVTIYAEIKRGAYMHRNHDWTETKKYSAYKAQRKADYLKTNKGADLKIGNDYEFAKFVEKMIHKKYSPEAILLYIEENNLQFKTKVCRVTLYSYIDKGIFSNISNKNLLRKGKKKKQKKTTVVRQPRKIDHSIEKRPKDIAQRLSFGHWEFDTVEGTKKDGMTLLCFTEMKTRFELIFKVKSKTAISTVNVINTLERKLGYRTFSKIFKTITCDNGSEFSNTIGMEFSRSGRQRTTIYYCHPYCASERGSNENQNGFIRRFIPKGTPISQYTTEYIKDTQDYINNYPRRLLNGTTSAKLFQKELKNLGIEKYFNFF